MRHFVKFKSAWIAVDDLEYYLILGNTRAFTHKLYKPKTLLSWSSSVYHRLATEPHFDLNAQVNYLGTSYTPLMVAIHSDVGGSHLPIVQFLLNHSADINASSTSLFGYSIISQTALSSATVLNNGLIVDALCRAKPDVSQQFIRPLDGELYTLNIFHYALRLKRLNIFEKLLDYDCPNKLKALNACDSTGKSVAQLFYENVSNDPKFNILHEKFKVYMELSLNHDNHKFAVF